MVSMKRFCKWNNSNEMRQGNEGKDLGSQGFDVWGTQRLAKGISFLEKIGKGKIESRGSFSAMKLGKGTRDCGFAMM